MKQLYENQIDQTQILDEIVTITSISRGLINENRLKLNIKAHIQTLFTARRFLLLHSEFMIHDTRIKYLLKQMQHDITLIREYLYIHTTGRLKSNIIDPIKISKQLLTQLSLPENPRTNIWHYYNF